MIKGDAKTVALIVAGVVGAGLLMAWGATRFAFLAKAREGYGIDTGIF